MSDLTPHESSAQSGALSRAVDPYRLAAGLIISDLPVAILSVLLCCGVSFVLSMKLPTQEIALWLGILVERAVHLIVVATIVWRWRRRLESKPGNSLSSVLCRTSIAGFFVWSITLLPVLLLSISENEFLILSSTAVITLSAIFVLQYFFYFATIGLIGGPATRLFRVTRMITLAAPVAPLKAASLPIALTVLVMALVLAPFPDGRSLLCNALAGSAEGIFTVLSTYTGLAFALILLDDPTWKSAGLEPYRQQRLETICIRADQKQSNFFRGRTALKLLFMAILVFVVNHYRQAAMPPAAQIKIVSVVVTDKTVNLALDVFDPEYRLAGFKPLAFSLGGKTGTRISTAIPSVSSSDSQKEVIPTVSPSADHVRLFLEFKTDRPGHAVKSLEDLWLWYYGVEIAPISPEMMQLVEQPKEAPTKEPIDNSVTTDV